MTLVGVVLQPDPAYLELLAPVFEEGADYYEVAPETLWFEEANGELLPNGFHRHFLALGARTGRPFVAHGVGLSVGSRSRADAPRARRWLARIAEDHASYRFLWYTDHLGVSVPGGLTMALPLATPMTPSAALAARRKLRSLQRIVADVGVENTVFYFTLGDPLEEPRFLARILSAPRMHLLLDLHNVFTMAENLGFDPEAYLERAPLDRVIEIHLAGGRRSRPEWLPSGRTLRLDGHDASVPEEVWKLFEAYAPRCPRLRGVTVERMEGSVGEGDVALLREELARARSVVRRLG